MCAETEREAFNFQPFDFYNRHSHDRRVQFMLPITQKECMLLGLCNDAGRLDSFLQAHVPQLHTEGSTKYQLEMKLGSSLC